ncbi:MAG: T9SS type A sorting domain-containing protein [Chlorobiota bacterium]|nr:MAG: T9SS type A sorting domain-containing protein [Chlorobiota bacterium]
MNYSSELEWDSLNLKSNDIENYSTQLKSKNDLTLQKLNDSCKLNKIVFGWNPYWVGSNYNEYDFSLLSDISYFGYQVDGTTGNYSSIHSWKTTDLVTKAKANGVRVNLCVTLFENHSLFFSNLESQKRLIDSLISLVKLRAANGVNIDFEAVPSSQKTQLTNFLKELGKRFHNEIPGSQISIALPAVDWGNTFDVNSMLGYVDLFIIMGYDYHWSSSAQSGPVSPKNNGIMWSAYDVTRSINYYLNKGVPKKNLCLGLPYYGYNWNCKDSTPASNTIGKGNAEFYSTAVSKANLIGRKWDPQSSNPYYVQKINDSSYNQCWYDDEESLGLKYDLVNMKDIGGIGIWALSYDAGSKKLWNKLKEKFTNCGDSPCQGSITDMGGSFGNYYDNDNFSFTIAPLNSKQLTIKFKSFNISNDEMKIFDGKDNLSKLIGVFTSTNSPNIITSKSGAITIQFKSDGASNSWGWLADWECSLNTGYLDEVNSKADILQVKLFTMQGKLISSFQTNEKDLYNKLNRLNLLKGVYLIQKISGDKFMFEKYVR